MNQNIFAINIPFQSPIKNPISNASTQLINTFSPVAIIMFSELFLVKGNTDDVIHQGFDQV